jgi:hypothetical protein
MFLVGGSGGVDILFVLFGLWEEGGEKAHFNSPKIQGLKKGLFLITPFLIELFWWS